MKTGISSKIRKKVSCGFGPSGNKKPPEESGGFKV
jgi:hypothetical protein